MFDVCELKRFELQARLNPLGFWTTSGVAKLKDFEGDPSAFVPCWAGVINKGSTLHNSSPHVFNLLIPLSTCFKLFLIPNFFQNVPHSQVSPEPEKIWKNETPPALRYCIFRNWGPRAVRSPGHCDAVNTPPPEHRKHSESCQNAWQKMCIDIEKVPLACPNIYSSIK